MSSAQNVAAALLALALAQPARAQVPRETVTHVQALNPRMEWDTLIVEVCVHGVVRNGAAIVTGYSIAEACARRIGVARLTTGRQCIESVCQRAWRLTFDAGGSVVAWVNERRPPAFDRVSWP